MKSRMLWILLFPGLARTNPANRRRISSPRRQKSLGGNIKFFLDNLTGRKSTGRDSTGDEFAELGDAIVDCLFDPVECVVVPIAEDPTDPYLLSALGMAVFSGGLAANSLINPASQRNKYFPILLDNTEETDQAFDDEGVSIIITKSQDKSPISFLVGDKHKKHGSKNNQSGGKHKQTGNRNKKSKQPDNGHRRPSGGKRRPQDKKKRPGTVHEHHGGANSPQHGGGQNGDHGEQQTSHSFIQKLHGGGHKPHNGGQKPHGGGGKTHSGGKQLHGGGQKPHGGGQKPHGGGQKHDDGGKKPHRRVHKQSRTENKQRSNEEQTSPRIESQGKTRYQLPGSEAFSARLGNSAVGSINDLSFAPGSNSTSRSKLHSGLALSESVSDGTEPSSPEIIKTEITPQLPPEKDQSSEKILDIERHPDLDLLKDFPGCGLLGRHNSSHHPWLGALYVVDINGTKPDKLISSVALLSITTKNHSRLPTIVVAPGSIMEQYQLSMTDTGLPVSGDNTVTAADLEIMGLTAEVRFGDVDKQVILAVLSIVQHPHFAGTECLVEPCGPSRYNNKNDVSILHLDTAPLWDLTDTENVFPACLPKEEGVLLTSDGWRVKDSQQRLSVLSSGVLGHDSSVQKPRISVSDQRKLTSCQTVSNKSLVTKAADGTLCVTEDNINSPTIGHLLTGKASNNKTVSVLGFLQDPQTTPPRLRHETASRLSCFLDWIAEQYNLRWESTTIISSVETGTSCPYS